MLKLFPHYTQLDAMDCGATCLRMIAKHYGRSFSNQTLREKSFITRSGVSLLGLSEAAESIGFHSPGVHIPYEKLMEVKLPCILHWNQKHFVVLYKVKGKRCKVKGNHVPFTFNLEPEFYIADPAGQKYVMNSEEFCKCWVSSKSEGKDTGIALLLEPTPDFYNQEEEEKSKRKLSFFFRYLTPYQSQIVQLFVGLIVGSILALIFPFLTQSWKKSTKRDCCKQ